MNFHISVKQRFLNTMDYKSVDRLPNHELGAWPQTFKRWEKEGLKPFTLHGNFFVGEEYFNMDPREFIPVNYGMMPCFEYKVLEKTDDYEIIQDGNGVIRKALIEGTVDGGRMSMDQFLRFPVEKPEDWKELKKRYEAKLPARYPPEWKQIRLKSWKNREHVLVLGENCSAGGFYWRAREWMGTENLSLAWYDYPEMMHDMMEFFADFTIEVSKPILEQTDVEYFNLSEDFAMKTGPLLSPETFKKFIYPHLKRLVSFMKSHGVKYVSVDSDGNPEVLIPMLLDAGVDVIWPLERAANMDPVRLRKKFGKNLRMWGGVDKRELSKDKESIDKSLKELIPLIIEGGFIPTVDHTVPPDVSWENFQYYMKQKQKLLEGKL